MQFTIGHGSYGYMMTVRVETSLFDASYSLSIHNEPIIEMNEYHAITKCTAIAN